MLVWKKKFLGGVHKHKGVGGGGWVKAIVTIFERKQLFYTGASHSNGEGLIPTSYPVELRSQNCCNIR